jgi:hypothetical protein
MTLQNFLNGNVIIELSITKTTSGECNSNSCFIRNYSNNSSPTYDHGRANTISVWHDTNAGQ